MDVETPWCHGVALMVVKSRHKVPTDDLSQGKNVEC